MTLDLAAVTRAGATSFAGAPRWRTLLLVVMTSAAACRRQEPAVTRSRALAALALSNEHLVLVRYWQLDTTDAATREFIGTFSRAVGRTPHQADVATFDAMGELAAAALAVGNTTRAVRDWLQPQGTNRPAYHGMLGPIEFHDGHRVVATLVCLTPDGWRPSH
jgi:hypothetical protein